MTLLVKNVEIVGTGKEMPERADVFVSGDKISAIGNFSTKRADTVIDGQGAYLAPGFIDVHAESDHFLDLLTQPDQEDFLKQGVTTIVCGQGGSSLAPLLYGDLASVEDWTDPGRTNVNWHTMEEFLSFLKRKPLGVNVATLIGHATIRRAITGDHFRQLTRNELPVFGKLLSRSLREGGFGLSVDFNSIHSRHATRREIQSLMKTVAQYGGIFAAVPEQKFPGFADSVAAILGNAREIGAKLLFSDFLPPKDGEKEYGDALAFMENLSGDCECRFALSPSGMSIAPLYRFLPAWAQNGTLDAMNENLRDEWLRTRIVEDLPQIEPNDCFILWAVRNDPLVGRSLRELMELYAVRDAKQALIKLMVTTKLRALVGCRNVDETTMQNALKHSRSLIGSRGTSPIAGRIPDAAAPFTKFLSLIFTEKLLPLDAAIRKITAEPANFFRLAGRGEIREGNFADLTGFRNGGIKFVVMNGKVAVKDGVVESAANGRVLKRPR